MSHKGAIYSTHTKFVDIAGLDNISSDMEGCMKDDGQIRDEARRHKVHIARRRVDSLSQFGRLNDGSKFNNLFWIKKASASDVFISSDIASREMTLNSGQDQMIDSITTSQTLAITRPRKIRFNFCSLPAEIREIIYDYTFPRPSTRNNGSVCRKPAFLRALERFASNDLIHEAKIAFYSINSFTYNILGGGFDVMDIELYGLLRNLVLVIPAMNPLTPFPTHLPLLYSSLRHLTLRPYSFVGLHLFIERILPNFEALTCLIVETVGIERKRETSVSEYWRDLLDRMVTGKNGECVKGLLTILEKEVDNDTMLFTWDSFAWVWKDGNANEDADGNLRVVIREIDQSPKREGILSIKKKVSHVRF
ncbi:hypothetical protein NHQ30_008959 [Ciborinia camelliae]|nr:hypothetical protein NHQ30_008959 [Ciborinia camelliae]